MTGEVGTLCRRSRDASAAARTADCGGARVPPTEISLRETCPTLRADEAPPSLLSTAIAPVLRRNGISAPAPGAQLLTLQKMRNCDLACVLLLLVLTAHAVGSAGPIAASRRLVIALRSDSMRYVRCEADSVHAWNLLSMFCSQTSGFSG